MIDKDANCIDQRTHFFVYLDMIAFHPFRSTVKSQLSFFSRVSSLASRNEHNNATLYVQLLIESASRHFKYLFQHTLKTAVVLFSHIHRFENVCKILIFSNIIYISHMNEGWNRMQSIFKIFKLARWHLYFVICVYV